MAEHPIEYGRVGFIQIDCGRIGGLGPAKRVADFAAKRGVTYVNHTFTSQPCAQRLTSAFRGPGRPPICEYPTDLQPLARDLTLTRIEPNADGEIVLPDAPGLGVEIIRGARPLQGRCRDQGEGKDDLFDALDLSGAQSGSRKRRSQPQGPSWP